MSFIHPSRLSKAPEIASNGGPADPAHPPTNVDRENDLRGQLLARKSADAQNNGAGAGGLAALRSLADRLGAQQTDSARENRNGRERRSPSPQRWQSSRRGDDRREEGERDQQHNRRGSPTYDAYGYGQQRYGDERRARFGDDGDQRRRDYGRDEGRRGGRYFDPPADDDHSRPPPPMRPPPGPPPRLPPHMINGNGHGGGDRYEVRGDGRDYRRGDDHRQGRGGEGGGWGRGPRDFRDNRGQGGGWQRGGPRGGMDPAFLASRAEQRADMTVSIWPTSPLAPFSEEEEEAAKEERRRKKKHRSGKDDSRSRHHRSRRHRHDDSEDSEDEEEERRRRRRKRSHRRSEDRADSEDDDDSRAERGADDRRHKRSRTSRRSRSRSASPGRSASASPAEARRKDKGKGKERDGDDDRYRDGESRSRKARRGSSAELSDGGRPGGAAEVSAAGGTGQVEDDDDAAEVGPQLPVDDTGVALDPRAYGGALLAGEGSAMAAYVASGQRIPRRGEIGLQPDQIEKYESAGFVMSGSRHRRMNAVRMRKENQVISAEEQRAILKMRKEEKMKREGEIVSQFKELVDIANPGR